MATFLKQNSPTKTGDNRNPDGTFKPGVSGNPGGRPSVSITAEVRKALLDVIDDPRIPNPDKKTALQLVIDKIMQKALASGDEKMLSKIWAYIDGLPKGSIGIDFEKEGLVEMTEFFRAMAKPKKQNDNTNVDQNGGGQTSVDNGSKTV